MKIFESPDNIFYEENHIYYDSIFLKQTAFAFNNENVEEAEVWIGKEHVNCPFHIKNYHYDGRLFYRFDPEHKYFHNEKGFYENSKELNIISFWSIKRLKNLKKIVNKLENKIGHSLKGWKIETSTGNYEDLYDYIKNIDKDKDKEKSISFEDDYKWHLMKQNDKRRKNRKINNFGSKKIKKWKEWEKPFENNKGAKL